MVGDEILGALDNPGEIADAELAAVAKRERDYQPGRVAERTEPGGNRTGPLLGEAARSQLLGAGEVETQQIATVIVA